MTGVNREMKHRAFLSRELQRRSRDMTLRLVAAVSTQGRPKYINERLRFTFTPNCKCEFVPRDQTQNEWFHASFIHENCSGQFLSPGCLFSILRNSKIESDASRLS